MDLATITAINFIALTVIVCIWADIRDIMSHAQLRGSRRNRRYAPPVTIVLTTKRGGTVIARAIKRLERLDYPNLRILAIIPSPHASPAGRIVRRAARRTSLTVRVASLRKQTIEDLVDSRIRKGLYLILPHDTVLDSDALLTAVIAFRRHQLDALELRAAPTTTTTLSEGVWLLSALLTRLTTYLSGNLSTVKYQPLTLYRARVSRQRNLNQSRIHASPVATTPQTMSAPISYLFAYFSAFSIVSLCVVKLTMPLGFLSALFAYIGATCIIASRLAAINKLPVSTGCALCLFTPLIGLTAWTVLPLRGVKYLFRLALTPLRLRTMVA